MMQFRLGSVALGVGLSAVTLGVCAAQQQGKKQIYRGQRPAVVMAGQTTVVKLIGQDLAPAEIKFAEPGLTAKIVKTGPNAGANDAEKKLGNTAVEVEVTLPADAGPGLHPFELTGEGVQPAIGKLLVDVAAPEVQEKEPNNALSTPQVLPSGPVTVTGKLDDGSDVYRFEARKGERWRIEIFARRTGTNLMFEPILRLRDPRLASVRAAVDQGEDCFIEYTAAADGPHVIEVFDGDFRGGGGDWTYRLTLRRL